VFLFGQKCARSDIYIIGMSTKGKYEVKGGFYIEAGELQIALERFKHVIPQKKNADEILKGVLMLQMRNRLELHGSDGEMYATFILNVEPTEGTALPVGRAVPYKALVDYLKQVPEKTKLKCAFADNEKGVPHMLIESEHGRKAFHGMDYHNYPKMPPFRCTNIALMNIDNFRDMLARTLFAADDKADFKLNGVYFHCLPDRTRFVATNRYILSMYERTDVVFPKPEGGVVPTRGFTSI
jgi:DNA polymerase III sliding clamp (beta) subunit (PCNA family)